MAKSFQKLHVLLSVIYVLRSQQRHRTYGIKIDDVDVCRMEKLKDDLVDGKWKVKSDVR